ncbi:hypothetical protein BC826DRAFT_973150 [Russula brevipes]|nr:hypothetical protein BC826DRAFT_973150 [Russula brevipes]
MGSAHTAPSALLSVSSRGRCGRPVGSRTARAMLAGTFSPRTFHPPVSPAAVVVPAPGQPAVVVVVLSAPGPLRSMRLVGLHLPTPSIYPWRSLSTMHCGHCGASMSSALKFNGNCGVRRSTGCTASPASTLLALGGRAVAKRPTRAGMLMRKRERESELWEGAQEESGCCA